VTAGRLAIDTRFIEYATWGEPTGEPAIVLLHEGLGSVALWRDFPKKLATATVRFVVAYSRLGYGGSSRLEAPRSVEYMHEEAQAWLPRVLDALAIRECVLFGHSDGASIALIHAADRPARVCGLVVLAPHVMVEDETVRSAGRAKVEFEQGTLRQRLAKYHEDVDGAFRGWNEIWLEPAFRTWNIESIVEQIEVPVLAIQGLDDEYGTVEQVESIRRRARHSEIVLLENCGHSPHQDRTDDVIALTRRFLNDVEIAKAGDCRQ
jgi:pimeloyl-ACP methyl ester carboxylesterase